MATKDLIHLYRDGDQWCAIYPIHSDLMTCQAVAFSPINVKFSQAVERERDYGRFAALKKLQDENPELQGKSWYCEYHD